MFVSVILPIYNEERNIEPVVNEIHKYLDTDKEILLINDGSKDGSLDEAIKLSSLDYVKVYSHTTNLGQSRAFRTGFDNASGDVFLTIDADGQHDPKYIPLMLEEICSGADMVSTRRENRGTDKTRYSMSKIYNWFLQKSLDLPFSDYNTGYQAITKECANNIGFTEKNIDLYNGLQRYLVPLAIINGFTVKEIPIKVRARQNGKSNIKFSKHFLPLIIDHLTFMHQRKSP